MKKYVMNKNVIHDGKAHVKGAELEAGHPAFKAMVEQGHADEMNFKGEGDSADEAAAPEVHSKRHGRK